MPISLTTIAEKHTRSNVLKDLTHIRLIGRFYFVICLDLQTSLRNFDFREFVYVVRFGRVFQ